MVHLKLYLQFQINGGFFFQSKESIAFLVLIFLIIHTFGKTTLIENCDIISLAHFFFLKIDKGHIIQKGLYFMFLENGGYSSKYMII